MPGYSTFPHSGPFPSHFASLCLQTDSPQPPHLTPHSLHNLILLLSISRRIIFRSICAPHLVLALGTAATGEHPTFPAFARSLRTPLYPLPPSAGLFVWWRKASDTFHMSVTIAISSIILATIIHHLTWQIPLALFDPLLSTTPSIPHHRNHYFRLNSELLCSVPPCLNYIPRRIISLQYPENLEISNIILVLVVLSYLTLLICCTY